MFRNKIVAFAIGLTLIGTSAMGQSLRNDSGPAEIPPLSFAGKQYVDSRGCVYIRAGSGSRVTWHPRVNRQGRVFCSSRNQPSLNRSQIAAASGEPATRLIKPASKPAVDPIASAVATTQTTVAKPAPVKKKPFNLFGSTVSKPKNVVKPAATTVAAVAKPAPTARAKSTLFQRAPKQTQKIHPGDLIRGSQTAVSVTGTQPAVSGTRTQQYVTPSVGNVLQGGSGYSVQPLFDTNAPSGAALVGGSGYVISPLSHNQVKSSVRGTSFFSRRNNRLALRTGPQAVHPADLIRGNQTVEDFGNTVVAQRLPSGVDPIHKITIYPTTITSDVTARGDAQMNLVWTNTVPRRLIKQVPAKQVVR